VPAEFRASALRLNDKGQAMITFETEDPDSLLSLFDEAIKKGNSKGGVATWEKVGDDYTHAAKQWHRLAYFTPHISPGKLTFNIVKNVGSNITVVVYGYYHGHLLETFLNHFDKNFHASVCSPLCDGGDFCLVAP
jgi:hypothetical protein